MGRGGDKVPMETMHPQYHGHLPAARQVFPRCSSALYSCAQPGRWFGLEMSLLTAVKSDPWMQTRLHRCSSCLFTPICKNSLPSEAQYRGTPHVMARGGMGTFLSPVLSLQVSHPSTAIIRGLQVQLPKVASTSRCVCWVRVVHLSESAAGAVGVIRVRTR